MEQTRITKEMRKADEQRGISDHLIRPRYLVWENVPGAFSSAGGEDFRAVIEEIVRIKISACDVPRPDTGAWQSAGAAILGTEFSLAWRVLDAQYWGVAQRRRRIFLVADFGGITAPEILFKQDSLFGNSAQSKGAGKGTAIPVERGIDATGGACLTPWDVQSRRIFDETGTWPALYSGGGGGHGYIQTEDRAAAAVEADQHNEVSDLQDTKKISSFHLNQRDEVIDLHGISGALLATQNMQMQTFITEPFLCLNDHGGERMDITEEITPTLRAGMNGHPPLIFDNHAQDSRFTGPVGVSQTVSAGFGMGGNNQPLVIAAQQEEAKIRRDNQSVLFENHSKDGRYHGPLGVSPTLEARMGTGGNNVPLVGNTAAFGNRNRDQNEISILQKSFCISGNTIDRQPQNGGNGLGCQTEIAYTLTATDHHAVVNRQGFCSFCESDVAGTECARQYKDATDLITANQEVVENRRQLIRRLTPLECERLQGFPDGWTQIPGASDSARYKALGNSVAIPCVEFLLRGIAYFLSRRID